MADDAVTQILQDQHGLITWAQALAAGQSEHTIQTRLRTGVWEAVFDGVFRLRGAPRTREQAALAAVLACGGDALASHRTAAWLWGIGPPAPKPEVTVTLARAPRQTGITVHRSKDVAEAVRSLRAGVPVTNPLRTLVDLGAGGDRSLVREAVHSAVADRLVTYWGIEAELSRLAQRGRRGVGPLRAVLAERFDRERGPSKLEAKMDQVIVRARVPGPTVERIVGPNGEYRCDYIWPEALLILEAKGFAAHGSPDATTADLLREAAIVEAGGYQILSAGWYQATRGAAVFARQLHTIYFARLQLLCTATAS